MMQLYLNQMVSTYHLAAMTDDVEMRITHILRGHDWLPSTPVHL